LSNTLRKNDCESNVLLLRPKMLPLLQFGRLKGGGVFLARPAHIPEAAWSPSVKAVPASFCWHKLLPSLVDIAAAGTGKSLTAVGTTITP